MKRITMILAICLCFINGFAAYLRNVPITVTQPDGTELHCFASGDEFFNYLHDKNGYTILQHPETGYYVYAEKRNGQLVATDFVAGLYDPASKGLQPHALISPEEWMQRRKAWEVEDPRPHNRDGEPNHGTLNNISIFIRFSDDTEFTNTYSSIDNMFNDMSGSYGTSMRSYFQAASYGAIDIPTTFYPGHNGETIISYQDTQSRSDFQPYNATTNPNGYRTDTERKDREFSLLQRAVTYINNNYPIPSNLNIDYDNDNFVDNVCFIVRGNVGAWSSLLWPHQWSLYDRYVYINGKRVYTFNFQLADATSYFNTSTMCHEMNHSLSAPDLYHYTEDYDGLHPVGTWDLMEYNSTPPQHCGAYMKMKYGHWIDEIPEITQAGTYILNPISSSTPSNIAYKIASQDPNQFYVLEYRDSSVETALPGTGLLIYRIDTRFEGNKDYDPNNGIYDEVYIFRPGGNNTDDGNYYAAHFGSDVNRSEFSSSTNPYPFFSDGTIDNVFRIYDITNNESTISFKYGSSACEPPTNLIATVIGTEVSLTWDAATDAQSYNVYRDGALIGNTSNTSYIDSSVSYGTHEYAISSMDATGLLSALTEAVQVTIQPVPTSLTVTKQGDNAVLSWTEPEWSLPENDNEVLTYSHGSTLYNFGSGNGTKLYYGHKYPASLINTNKILYKVSFYATETGAYKLFVYNANSGNSRPQTQIYTQDITVTGAGWNDIILSNPLQLNASKDLWVFIYDPVGRNYPMGAGSYEGTNSNGNYTSSNPTSSVSIQSVVMLINTYITNGAFTYNLYDNTNMVAQNISGSSYTISNIANNVAYQYTLKTNLDNSESASSNMAGLAVGNASLASLSLASNDHMTVTEGSTLTVSGAITNNGTAANLVIENGAQLVSGPVNGTIFMDITGYTNTNNDYEGYNLIASPVDGIQPGNVTNMTNGTYDLYAWDPNEQLEWRNFEAQGNFTTLDAGMGYLYANLATTTLEFAGQLNANFLGVNNLAYTANDDLHSLNLVGNPYAHQAEFSIANSGSWVNTPNYLTLNPAGDGFIANVASGVKIVLNPMQAVLVQTTAANEGFFEYSDMPPRGDDPELLFDAVRGIVNLKVCNSDGDLVDNAIVRFAEGGIMRKLYLSNNSTRVFIPRGNDEMAIVRSDNERELPVNFKASRNGTYTLSVDNESLGLDYLHLIDNLTGEDVDFLATPSYTFEAKTSDYASRFRLLFAPIGEDADGDNAPFAFISNGNITINQEGTLQIVDMTGRVVMAGDAEHCISTAGMTAGMYVLRLITDEGVKTQKIVIE